MLEDSPHFNAGSSSVRNEVGGLQMDASIMDGRTLDIGAIIGLKEAKNPVSVARALLREKQILLAGEGAEAFAHNCERDTPTRRHAASSGAGCDTVGCVARDPLGNLAVATSTGGLAARGSAGWATWRFPVAASMRMTPGVRSASRATESRLRGSCLPANSCIAFAAFLPTMLRELPSEELSE